MLVQGPATVRVYPGKPRNSGSVQQSSLLCAFTPGIPDAQQPQALVHEPHPALRAHGAPRLQGVHDRASLLP